MLFRKSIGFKEVLRFSEPPRPSTRIPGVGHIAGFLRNPVEFAKRCYEECGDAYTVNLGFSDAYVLSGAKGQEFVLMAHEDTLSMGDAFSFILPGFYGKNFKYDKKLGFPFEHAHMLHGVLKESLFRNYADISSNLLEGILSEMPDQGTLNFNDFGKNLFLRAAFRCFIGEDAKLEEEFTKYYFEITKEMSPGALIVPGMATLSLLKIEPVRKKFFELFKNKITNLTAEKSSSRGPTILEHLSKTTFPDGRPLSLEEITGLVLQLIFAAHGPTSGAFVWSGLYFHHHPAYLAQIYREQEALKLESSAVDYDVLKRVPILERGLKEVLRLQPPTMVIPRVLRKDVSFDSYRLKKGNFVLVFPEISHQIPQLFAQPQVFDPERFASPREEDKRNKHAYLPFGGGAHACAGRSFAFLQLKMAWTLLLRDFEFRLTSLSLEPSYRSIAVAPKVAPVVHYRRRTKKPDSGLRDSNI
jgi:sterol 14-demethylase